MTMQADTLLARRSLGAIACALALATSSPAAQLEQKSHASAEDAAAALAAAAKAGDTAALIEILGPEAKSIVVSGDPVADAAMRERFVRSYEEAHEIVPAPDDRMVLQTGKDEWPLPIPLVDTGEGWRFDTAAGQREILNRRIGANELATIQTCLAYVDAQREYYDRNPGGAPMPQYAQKIASGEGKRDGLYWKTSAGEPSSPLGELFASARGEGYGVGGGEPIPYHGYYYRILKAQGPHAPGGAASYLVRGEMIGGFALMAYPAGYDSSGVMSFIVNQDGVVYEKNLGPDTAEIARAMTIYDPDESWTKVGEPAGDAGSNDRADS